MIQRGTGYTLLLLATSLWLALVLAAPWARSEGWEWGAWLYAFFAPVCHQIAERSFHFLGEPLAVCHRCTGLYVGFGVGLVAWPRLGRARNRLREHPRLMLAFFAPILIDALLLPNTPLTRFVTGFLASFPVGLFAWIAALDLFRSRPFAALGERDEATPT